MKMILLSCWTSLKITKTHTLLLFCFIEADVAAGRWTLSNKKIENEKNKTRKICWRARWSRLWLGWHPWADIVPVINMKGGVGQDLGVALPFVSFSVIYLVTDAFFNQPCVACLHLSAVALSNTLQPWRCLVVFHSPELFASSGSLEHWLSLAVFHSPSSFIAK